MKLDEEFADWLDEIITIKANKLFERKMKEQNIIKPWVAIVVNVVDSTADVKLPNDNNVLVNKKNKTGEVLKIGDEVYLISPQGTLSSSFIAWKK
jgi:hypothetical protein